MIVNFFNVSDGEWLAKASMGKGSLELEGPGAQNLHRTISGIQNKRGLTDEELFEQLPHLFRTLVLALREGDEEQYGFTVPTKGDQ